MKVNENEIFTVSVLSISRNIYLVCRLFYLKLKIKEAMLVQVFKDWK